MSEVKQYIGARYVTKVYENSLDASSAEWEANTAYEPLTLVTYNNSSYLSKKDIPANVGDPASNPEYWVVTGAYNGQIAYLQSQINNILAELQESIITPEMYGAVGDGVADDTTAVQDALTNGSVIMMSGDYKITGTLCVEGTKHIFGKGKIHAYLPAIDPYEYIMAFGCTSLGVTGETFHGIVEGLTFIAHTGNFNYGLGFCNADNVEVRGVKIDFSNGNCKNKMIFFGDNSDVAIDNSTGENYIVDSCICISDSNPNATTNPCESISLVRKTHVTVSNNTIINCKDDGIGIHICTDVEVLNNFMHSYGGRILCSYLQHAVIADNMLEIEPNIFCQGIQVEYEPTASLVNRINTDVKIINNTVDYGGTTDPSAQHGIRVHGLKNSLISGNILISGTGDQGRILIENQPVTTHTPTFIYSENNEICDNKVHDIFFVLYGASGADSMQPNYFHDNVIEGRLGLNSYYCYSMNNVLLPSTFNNTTMDGYVLDYTHMEPNAKFAFSGTGSNVDQDMEIDGFTEIRFNDRAYLMPYYRFMMDGDNPLSGSDYYTFTIYKNGSVIGTIKRQSMIADISNIAMVDRLFVAGDILKITFKYTGTVPATPPHHIQLGMFYRYLRDC